MESRLQQAFYARTFSPDENKRRRRAAIPRPAGKAEDPDGQAKTHGALSANAGAPMPRRQIPSIAIGRPGCITSCRQADYDTKPPLGPALNLPTYLPRKGRDFTKKQIPAWAEGQISGTALLASAGAAVQACFIRAGISNEVQKSLPQ